MPEELVEKFRALADLERRDLSQQMKIILEDYFRRKEYVDGGSMHEEQIMRLAEDRPKYDPTDVSKIGRTIHGIPIEEGEVIERRSSENKNVAGNHNPTESHKERVHHRRKQ